MKNKYWFFFPAITWLIVSTVLFTLPASAFSREKWTDNIPIFDKWVHLGIFIILSVLACNAVYKTNKVSEKLFGKFILIGMLCLLYGVAIEYIQLYWVPFRSFDLGDIIADGVGSLLGVIFSVGRYKKNRPL
ncbi:MAG: VanZ family protein [Chitinophagaceae bacterium]